MPSNFSAVFLDSHDGLNGSDVGLWIALITAAVLVIGLLFNAMTLRESKNARNLETVRNFFNDFTKIEEMEPDVQEKEKYLKYATAYLDLFDAIAYLNRKNILSNELTAVFYGHFRFGVQLREWYGKNVQTRKFDEEFENCAKWIDYNWRLLFKTEQDYENRKKRPLDESF